MLLTILLVSSPLLFVLVIYIEIIFGNSKPVLIGNYFAFIFRSKSFLGKTASFVASSFWRNILFLAMNECFLGCIGSRT